MNSSGEEGRDPVPSVPKLSHPVIHLPYSPRPTAAPLPPSRSPAPFLDHCTARNEIFTQLLGVEAQTWAGRPRD